MIDDVNLINTDLVLDGPPPLTPREERQIRGKIGQGNANAKST